MPQMSPAALASVLPMVVNPPPPVNSPVSSEMEMVLYQEADKAKISPELIKRQIELVDHLGKESKMIQSALAKERAVLQYMQGKEPKTLGWTDKKVR